MGRKNWKEHVSNKGPGRKARKQGDPELPLKLQEKGKKLKSGAIGGRIRQRARKRQIKEALKQKAVKLEAKKAKSRLKDVEVDHHAVPPPSVLTKPVPSMKELAERKSADTKKHVKKLFSGGSDGSSGE